MISFVASKATKRRMVSIAIQRTVLVYNVIEFDNIVNPGLGQYSVRLINQGTHENGIKSNSRDHISDIAKD